jgi:hypothetical protein
MSNYGFLRTNWIWQQDTTVCAAPSSDLSSFHHSKNQAYPPPPPPSYEVQDAITLAFGLIGYIVEKPAMVHLIRLASSLEERLILR